MIASKTTAPAPGRPAARRPSVSRLLLAGLLSAGAAVTASATGHGWDIDVPPVPANLEVPEGHRPFLKAYAVGTQNYVCLPRTTAPGLGWTLHGPQATLFDDRREQILTHYLSGNPLEGGTPRATWQHSRDTSAAWALALESSTDSAYVAPGAIPWLLLKVVGATAGPTGGYRMSRTAYIQRVNTSGGVAPAGDCPTLGARVLVPYTTDYIFYKERER